MMPIDMPESVLVRFTGTRRPGITLRDLVHAIPYFARKQGMLTLDKKGKVNVFSGRILEIEGLEDLSVEHASSWLTPLLSVLPLPVLSTSRLRA